MSFLGGLARGFGDAAGENRRTASQESEARAAREQKALEWLSQADDPEIAHAAVSGLLDMATGQRKVGGLDKFLGRRDQGVHPAVAHVLQLMQSPAMSPGVPVRQGIGSLSAAMPPTPAGQAGGGPASPAQLGSPSGDAAAGPPPAPGPLTPAMTGVAPGQLQAAPLIGRGDPVPHPRQVFLTPQQRAAQAADLATRTKVTEAEQVGAAGVRGTAAGLRAAGVPDNEITLALRGKVGGAGQFAVHPEGVVSTDEILANNPGAKDTTGNPLTPGKFVRTQQTAGGTQYVPTVAPASAAPKPPRYLSNQLINGKPATIRVWPDGRQEFVSWQAARDSTVTVTNEDGSQEAIHIPAAFSGGQGGGGTAPPPAPGAGSATPAATPSPGAGGPPGMPAPVARGSAPTGGVRTRGAQAKNVTVKLADGQVVAAWEQANGALLDPATKQPFPAGTMKITAAAANAAKPNANEQKVLDTIAASRPIIESVRGLLKGRESDNGLIASGVARLNTMESAAGFSPSSTLYKQLIPLVDHLKILATSPYLQGIRNGTYIKQIQQFLPDTRDTPAAIMTKIAGLDQTLPQIEAAMSHGPTGGGGGSAATAGGPPGPVPPQVLAAGPGEHDFANGQTWVVAADGKSATRIK